MSGGRRLAALALVVASACSGGGEERETGPAIDLLGKVRAGERVTYKATYAYTNVGPNESAVEATFFVAQRPPDSVRWFETTTRPAQGRPITVRSWIVRKEGRTYACYDLGGVACSLTPGPRGAFGYAPVDEAIELARTARAFSSVREAAAISVAGERATCFRAQGRRATPAPVRSPQPRYVPTQYVYELCYASDGVPLRIGRTASGPVPSGSNRARWLVEARQVTRTVSPPDLELPGPVRTPSPPGT